MRRIWITTLVAFVVALVGAPTAVGGPPRPEPGTQISVEQVREAPPPGVISSRWHIIFPPPLFSWMIHITSWNDNDNSGTLSRSDTFDYRFVNPRSGRDFGPTHWAHVLLALDRFMIFEEIECPRGRGGP